MKEIYIAPNAEMIIFTPMEKLTTFGDSVIPYLDDENRKGPPSGGSQWIEDV